MIFMAILYGQSGAWKSVLSMVHAADLKAQDPDDLSRQVTSLEEEWIKIQHEAEEAFDELSEKLNQQKKAAYRNFDNANGEIEKQYETRQRELHTMFSSAGKINISGKIQRWTNQWFLRLNQRQLDKWRATEVSRFKIHVQKCNIRVDEHQENRVDFLSDYQSQSRSKLDTIISIAESRELVGAVAELEALEYLKRLPESYHVLADVCLKYHRYIYYKEEQLRTAQLDFVVVGPPGLFVIEVKRWSRKFTESGEYHDPYKQVDRASYLCFKLLKEAGLQTKCRTIIVTRSPLPPKPDSIYAKVLRPEELCGYLKYYGAVLNDETIQSLVSHLIRHESVI